MDNNLLFGGLPAMVVLRQEPSSQFPVLVQAVKDGTVRVLSPVEITPGTQAHIFITISGSKCCWNASLSSTGRTQSESLPYLLMFDISNTPQHTSDISAALLALQTVLQDGLAAQRNDLVDFLDDMHLAYYRTDSKHVTIYSNRAELDFLGMSAQQLRSVTRDQLYFNPDDRKTFLQAIQAGNGRVEDHLVELKKADGSRFAVRTHSRQILDPSTGEFAGVHGIYRDVTEQEANRSHANRLVRLSQELHSDWSPTTLLRETSQMFQTKFIEVWSLGDHVTSLDGHSRPYFVLRAMSGFMSSDVNSAAFMFPSPDDEASPPSIFVAARSPQSIGWLDSKQPEQFTGTFNFSVDISDKYSLDTFVAIPIIGPDGRPHHYVFVYAQSRGRPISLIQEARASSEVYTAAYHRYLQRECDAAQHRLFELASHKREMRPQPRSLQSLVSGALPVIRSVTGAEHCSVYLWNDGDSLYRLYATTGIVEMKRLRLRRNEVTYQHGEGLTGSVPQAMDGVINIPDINYCGRIPHVSRFNEVSLDKCCGWLGFLLRSPTGKRLGIIRCVNRTEVAAFPAFTREDIWRLGRMGGPLGAMVDILGSQERLSQSLRKVTHETLSPVLAIAGFAEHHIARRAHYSDGARIGALQTIKDYADYARLQLENRAITSRDELALTCDDVDLESVVRQAIHLVKPFVRARPGFATDSIQSNVVPGLPKVRCDFVRMLQLCVNVLDNAIKYARREPNKFKIVISVHRCEDGMAVTFEDWGVGIADGDDLAIWEYGVRGRNTNIDGRRVSGHGIGCFIAKVIADRHDFALRVDSKVNPTRIALTIPSKACCVREE